MRVLGPLYEILALGEARFRSKLISASRMTVTSKVVSPVMYHLPEFVRICSVSSSRPSTQEGEYYRMGLGKYYRVGTFDVIREVREGLDRY